VPVEHLFRAKQVARRKEIYETLHPEAKHGANQHSRSGQLVHSFAEATAHATGKDARTVRRDAERGLIPAGNPADTYSISRGYPIYI
jgi:hypothetical protein